MCFKIGSVIYLDSSHLNEQWAAARRVILLRERLHQLWSLQIRSQVLPLVQKRCAPFEQPRSEDEIQLLLSWFANDLNQIAEKYFLDPKTGNGLGWEG